MTAALVSISMRLACMDLHNQGQQSVLSRTGSVIDQQAYVVTHDLGERIQNLRPLGIKTPGVDDPLFIKYNASERGILEKT